MGGPCLRVLLLVSVHNSLSQRAYIALTELGDEVSVEVVASGAAMEAAVAAHRPDLIVCPVLKSIIPESIWAYRRCLVVHPGRKGDRGPSSLDWAIEPGMREWGVTVLEAQREVDASDIWATRTFRMRDTGKNSLSRDVVRHAAASTLVEAMTKIADSQFRPEPLDYGDPAVVGRLRPTLTHADRAIDWSVDGSATIVRRLRAAEGDPGVLDSICAVEFDLFGAHAEHSLRGGPGVVIARRNGAICRATVDGSVWITHLRPRRVESLAV